MVNVAQVSDEAPLLLGSSAPLLRGSFAGGKRAIHSARHRAPLSRYRILYKNRLLTFTILAFRSPKLARWGGNLGVPDVKTSAPAYE